MVYIMVTKILIFSGAPDSNTLDWGTSGLLSEFQDTTAQFAGLVTESGLHPTTSSAPELAAWRSLSLGKATIPTRFSQQYGIGEDYGPGSSVFSPSPEFLTTVSLSFDSDGDGGEHNSVLSQFYEHSIVLHEELSSSQLISQSAEQSTSFLDDTTSFQSGNGSQPGSIKGPILFRGSDLVGDLRTIPSAAYLVKIQPQTMTYNLIVGIISISQPRAVKTSWGATKYLVEVLVGDETKAGFAITFWLPSDNVEESPLAGLRPQDVVLVQNVAFNVFRQKVYGSSLRKGWTKVHLFYRMKLDSLDTGGYYSTSDLSSARSAHPQLEKTRRVRDWVLHFVGRGVHNGAKPDSKPRWDRPPADDTQL
ncbi:uncharacterized protein B0H64DRAFT_235169 [Chaetomium fimeti]|uniref:Telomeric single stranded DNA binding POT1/Cdc13 domain-containing protein n=1 Tax=Chaetomium fimeti TaxID=1854472 RepID=A0AAE0LPP1_9PEZI|nr:hypothetical protein B0H64DRAFT_235169 [Chaetomium fimeti]